MIIAHACDEEKITFEKAKDNKKAKNKIKKTIYKNISKSKNYKQVVKDSGEAMISAIEELSKKMKTTYLSKILKKNSK